MPRLQQQQPQDQYIDRGGQPAEPTAAPAAARSRTAMASALVRERRRVALRHRRRPTEETRAVLAAIDLALAEYQIDIPALERARAARRAGRKAGSG